MAFILFYGLFLLLDVNIADAHHADDDQQNTDHLETVQLLMVEENTRRDGDKGGYSAECGNGETCTLERA